jgi:hypothetical protein
LDSIPKKNTHVVIIVLLAKLPIIADVSLVLPLEIPQNLTVHVMMDIMKILPMNVLLVITNVLLVKLMLIIVSLVLVTETMPHIVIVQSTLMMNKPQPVHLVQMHVNLVT